MTETFNKPSSHELHRKSMDAKAAAKEARLKAALRSNLRRRKEGSQADDTAISDSTES
jgi:hypothetical protein